MKRIIEVDMECRCKKLSTALNRFFGKYPDLEYWRGTFEYMAENGLDHENDSVFGDGTRNHDWRYALHLDIEDNYFYIGIIERA